MFSKYISTVEGHNNKVQYSNCINNYTQSVAGPTKDTLYPPPPTHPNGQAMGCLLLLFLKKNLPCYKGTALYFIMPWSVFSQIHMTGTPQIFVVWDVIFESRIWPNVCMFSHFCSIRRLYVISSYNEWDLTVLLYLTVSLGIYWC